MAKEIEYKDINKERYQDSHWAKNDINEELKNYKIINVETLKSVIRFWYYKED